VHQLVGEIGSAIDAAFRNGTDDDVTPRYSRAPSALGEIPAQSDFADRHPRSSRPAKPSPVAAHHRERPRARRAGSEECCPASLEQISTAGLSARVPRLHCASPKPRRFREV
jgi:hypothetical protein